jgi:hypothetical protein
MRWHKEEHKQDLMLRQLADGLQWRKVDRKFLDFGNDSRNIRFGLSTNGMNPFGEWGSSHSTWPETLCMFNLPSWVFEKLSEDRVYGPSLISSPQSPLKRERETF